MTGPEEWARCRPWIEAALEYGLGTHTIEDIEAAIEAGEAHFWPGRACAGVTEFWDTPRCRVLVLWLAGGDLTELVSELCPAAEAWGVANGCTKAIVEGRPGWTRALAPDGYSPISTKLTKDLVS